MNYQAVYDRFILDRQSKSDPVGYSEKHHIIPRSMGGSNRKSNLVRLSPSDHLFAHKLLAKIHNTRGMWFAFLTMCTKGGQSARGIVASRREYERARFAYAESLKTDHPMRGRKLTEEHKRKVSENSPRLSGPDHPMFGKKHRESTRKKMSDAIAKRGGIISPMKGKTHSPQIREKWKKERAGMGNARADKKIYHLFNDDGRTFSGTRYEFHTSDFVNVSKSGAHLLLNGKITSLKGWKLKND